MNTDKEIPGQFAFVNGLGGGLNDNISYSWGPRLNQGLLIPHLTVRSTNNGNFVRGGDTLYNGLPISSQPRLLPFQMVLIKGVLSTSPLIYK
jgi:hypothetical protein